MVKSISPESFKFPTIATFVKSELANSIGESDLCVIDIDGVFFHGVMDPTFWRGKIKNENLDPLRLIIEKGTTVWVFSDRYRFAFWGSYKTQIMDALSSGGRKLAKRFNGSAAFLKSINDFYGNALILNAKKPGQESKNVILKGMEKFKRVFYLAAQDFPGVYDDKKLVNEISVSACNLYFIDIRG